MSNNTLTRMPVTFQDLTKVLEDHDFGRVTIGNNTTAELDLDDRSTIIVRLHGHAIVKVLPDGVLVRHCGWVTTTTFDRLNRFTKPLGYTCFRKGGSALVNGPGGFLDTIEADLWTTCFA